MFPVPTLQGVEEIALQSFDHQPVGAKARGRFLQRGLRDVRVDLREGGGYPWGSRK
jgi:hypothetical protein